MPIQWYRPVNYVPPTPVETTGETIAKSVLAYQQGKERGKKEYIEQKKLEAEQRKAQLEEQKTRLQMQESQSKIDKAKAEADSEKMATDSLSVARQKFDVLSPPDIHPAIKDLAANVEWARNFPQFSETTTGKAVKQTLKDARDLYKGTTLQPVVDSVLAGMGVEGKLEGKKVTKETASGGEIVRTEIDPVTGNEIIVGTAPTGMGAQKMAFEERRIGQGDVANALRAQGNAISAGNLSVARAREARETRTSSPLGVAQREVAKGLAETGIDALRSVFGLEEKGAAGQRRQLTENKQVDMLMKVSKNQEELRKQINDQDMNDQNRLQSLRSNDQIKVLAAGQFIIGEGNKLADRGVMTQGEAEIWQGLAGWLRGTLGKVQSQGASSLTADDYSKINDVFSLMRSVRIRQGAYDLSSDLDKLESSVDIFADKMPLFNTNKSGIMNDMRAGALPWPGADKIEPRRIYVKDGFLIKPMVAPNGKTVFVRYE